jgi:hypothetical protein
MINRNFWLRIPDKEKFSYNLGYDIIVSEEMLRMND